MSTVIRVKYTSNAQLVGHHDSSGRATATTSGEKETLININCSIGSIIDYVRELTSHDGEFDFIDEANSELKNVFSFPKHMSGLEIFKPHSIYRIIEMKRDPSGLVINESKKISRTRSQIIIRTHNSRGKRKIMSDIIKVKPKNII